MVSAVTFYKADVEYGRKSFSGSQKKTGMLGDDSVQDGAERGGNTAAGAMIRETTLQIVDGACFHERVDGQ
jgi:hypothetical protein